MIVNNVSEINIKKNKELFEYEMTEVLLNLKGEFAAFSCKETPYAKTSVSASKLEIPKAPISRVTLLERHVDISVHCPDSVFVCPKAVSVTPVKINLPEQPPQAAPVSVGFAQAPVIAVPKYHSPVAIIPAQEFKHRSLCVRSIPTTDISKACNLHITIPSLLPKRISLPQRKNIIWSPAKVKSSYSHFTMPVLPKSDFIYGSKQFSMDSVNNTDVVFPTVSVPPINPNIKTTSVGKLTLRIPDTKVPIITCCKQDNQKDIVQISVPKLTVPNQFNAKRALERS